MFVYILCISIYIFFMCVFEYFVSARESSRNRKHIGEHFGEEIDR